MTSPTSALAIAHRAGNSLAGLHAANRMGVDVIECDVHHHRGRLEVRHLKTAGPLPFLWDRWELASAAAPRLGLHELLEADEHGTTFMLDLKGRSSATAHSVATLLHAGGHHHEVLVCGRHWPSVLHVARLPYVRAVLSARNRVELARLRQRVAGAPRVHGVSVHASLLDPETVEHLLGHVEVLMTWPVNDVATLDAVLAVGANGVISDEPDVLAELLARRGGVDAPG
jgi:glycerophosphoryl diester phosphodiesterase